MNARPRRRAARDVPVHAAGGRSVYADLGVPQADQMLVKAELVARIAGILSERGLTQAEAGALLGITQPKLSNILRGHFRGISERRLMDCLTRLGRDVQIVIRPTAGRRRIGAVSVTGA